MNQTNQLKDQLKEKEAEWKQVSELKESEDKQLLKHNQEVVTLKANFNQ